MTCNIARPYNKDLTPAVPSFSRLREDMIFRKGDAIEIFAFPRSRPLSCSWRLSRNMLATPFLSGEGEVCMDQSVKIAIPSESLAPGFYDVAFTVNSTANDREEGRTTFGYRIDEIQFTASRPADFEEFWAKAKQTLSSIPLNAEEIFVKDMGSAEVSSYNISSASIPEEYDPAGKRVEKVKLFKLAFDSAGPRRMHGWLAVPDGKGPHPGLLVLPGAGCAQVPAPVEHARHGYVSLILQIHGMEVDQEKYETPEWYLKWKGGGPEEEYYYNVFLACVQAVNYLASRPDVDPNRLAVTGGSQGGMLTIVTAALCPNIKAAASSICAFSYWPYREWADSMNAKKSDGKDVASPPFDRQNPRQNVLSYFDPLNFAPMVKAPTLMSACLCDTPSPPTTVYAVYRGLGTEQKEICWSPGTDHELMFAFERRAWRWMEKYLAAKVPQ